MKKHVSPNSIFTALLSFTLFSTLYAAVAVNFGNKELNFWSIALVSISVISVILQIILLIKSMKNRRKQQSDEYTDSLLYRSGYFTYYIVAFMITILFISISLVLGLDSDGVDISDVLDIKLVLGLLAFIQVTGATFFSSFYFFFDKKSGKYEDEK